MIVTGGLIAAGTGVTLLARVVGNLGVPVTRASLSAVSWLLTNLATGATAAGTFPVAGTVYDALQVGDPRWNADATGYNFLGQIPAANFPVPSGPAPLAGPVPVRWQVAVTITPVAGEPVRWLSQWTQAG